MVDLAGDGVCDAVDVLDRNLLAVRVDVAGVADLAAHLGIERDCRRCR